MRESIKRFMLAAPTKNKDLLALNYPLLVSPKIDGIRAGNVHGQLLSRTMKPIPNLHTQSLFNRPEFHGFDGELAVGRPYDKNLMQQTMSGVMARDGTPNVHWYIFDNWTDEEGFKQRFELLKYNLEAIQQEYEHHSNMLRVKLVPHILINRYEDLLAMEEKCLNMGFEGLMLRKLDGPYKQNRSTVREGYLLKLKRFEDSEAEILGFMEQMHNDNEATKDERGFTKRATHQENKRAAGVLGAFQVRDIHSGVEFDVGTGFTAEQRQNLWEGRKYLLGKLIKYKHFAVGVKDKPRFPTFLGFRDKRDM